MSESRNEARRRKILENAQKRLEKLEGLKKPIELHCDDDTKEVQPSNCIETENVHTEDDLDSITNEGERVNKEGDNFESEQKHVNTSTHNPSPLEHLNSLDDTTSEPKAETTWFMKKYRLILFALLAWVVYLVVMKDFDFVLAYIIGRKLPKQDVSKLFLAAFVGVEIQVSVLELFVKKTDSENFSMFRFVLQLLRFPASLIAFTNKMISVCSGIFTDFCVYVFVVAIFKTLDDSIV